MSLGSTATMRDFGSAFQSVEVKPVLNLPYAGSRGRYMVTVNRRPHDFVPTEAAFSVAARMFAWLRASARHGGGREGAHDLPGIPVRAGTAARLRPSQVPAQAPSASRSTRRQAGP